MNEKGREVLVKTAMEGHSQVRHVLHHSRGDCALGVLHLAYHGYDRAVAVGCYTSGGPDGGLHVRETRNEYGMTDGEQAQIVFMNDALGYDFLTIARKLEDAA